MAAPILLSVFALLLLACGAPIVAAQDVDAYGAPTPAKSAGNATQTKCAVCCSPGGDCQQAFKNGPGLCCGLSAEGTPYCCPSRDNLAVSDSSPVTIIVARSPS